MPKHDLIDEYLQSERARTHVCKLLAPSRRLESIYGNPSVKIGRLGSLNLRPADTWTAWHTVHLNEPMHNGIARVLVSAYYRADDDCRIIVTDLGRGLHELRLRTGRLVNLPECAQLVLVGANSSPDTVVYGEDSTLYACQNARSSERRDHSTVEAVDLSDAICRVLLACWRVSWLGS